MRAQIFKFFLLFILLYSCSFKSVVIPNLAYILTQSIESKLDLYYSEEKLLQADLEKILYEQVSNAKDIAKLVESFDIKNINPVALSAEISKYYNLIAPKITKVLSVRICKFTKARQAEFIKIAREDNKKLIEKINENKTTDIITQYEKLFGSLSKKQINFINQNKDVYKEMNEHRLQRRLKSQSGLEVIFKTVNENSCQIKIEQLFNSQFDTQKDKLRFIPAFEVIKNFSLSLSAEQLKHFNQKKSEIKEWLFEYIKYYSSAQ